MNRSAEEIEREVEMTRAHVEDTVEALKDKMSLGQMVDEAARYFQNSGGGEMVSNLGTQVKANPIPLMLVGVGLAWLMSGRGQPSMEVPHWRFRHDGDDRQGRRYAKNYVQSGGGSGAYPSGVDYRDYAEAFADDGDHRRYGNGSRRGAGGGVMSSVAEHASSAASGVTGGVKSGLRAGGSAAGSAASAVGSAASAVGSAASSVGEAVSSAAETVASGAYQAGSAAASGARYAGDGVVSGGRYVGDTAYEAYDWTSRNAAYYGSRARRTFLDVLDQEPLVVGALGVAVGAAIGALLPPTEVEDEYLGEHRDHLKHEAEAMAREQWERGKEMAEEAYVSAKSEFGKDDESGLTLAEKAERAARAAAEKVMPSDSPTSDSSGGSGPGSSAGSSAASGSGANPSGSAGGFGSTSRT
ncbi:DUF3618 domain-containing protein [Faunimonas sp. B44]|uniref:DUF3618 domain-containing protein n=1 Tax=Faunimonas sp. B44 TaxID=3461493 RepID=UPI00404448B2